MKKDRPEDVIGEMIGHLKAALMCAALCEDADVRERIRKITTCRMTVAQRIDYLDTLHGEVLHGW